MMPVPRPKTSSEQVRTLVKQLAEECQKEDLAYADELAAVPVDVNDDDNLSMSSCYSFFRAFMFSLKFSLFRLFCFFFLQSVSINLLLGVGWNFPKKEQINKDWANWNTLFEQQTDLEGFFRSHFDEEVKLFKEAVEQEKREMLGE